MKTLIILICAAAAIHAMAAWLNLVKLTGGSLEDAIRIPVMAAMIAAAIWWPVFIRRKLREQGRE